MRSRSSTSSTSEASSRSAGGKVRIHELAALVPAAANAAHYARIVREMATLRGLIRAGNEIARLGIDRPRETPELVDRAEQTIFELAQSRVTQDFSHIEELLKEGFERITALYEDGADVTGVAAGFKEIDHLTSGFQPGNLVILAARPSMGKSGLALCMAANLARARRDAGRAVHARDVEGRSHAAPHVLGGEGRVPAAADGQARSRRLAAPHRRVRPVVEGADLRRRHGVDHDDGDPVEGAATEDAGARAGADHRRLPPADDVRRVRREPRPGGLGHLAVAEGARPRPRGSRAGALTAVARRRAAPRQAADPVRPPGVGSLEQDADLVFFIYRDEYYDSESDQQGLAEVHLAKHRNGPTGTAKLSFLKRFAKFADLAGGT